MGGGPSGKVVACPRPERARLGLGSDKEPRASRKSGAHIRVVHVPRKMGSGKSRACASMQRASSRGLTGTGPASAL